jgi:hypothetical protein
MRAALWLAIGGGNLESMCRGPAAVPWGHRQVGLVLFHGVVLRRATGHAGAEVAARKR